MFFSLYFVVHYSMWHFTSWILVESGLSDLSRAGLDWLLIQATHQLFNFENMSFFTSFLVRLYTVYCNFFFLLDLLDRTDGDVLMFSKFPFSYSNKLLLTLLWLVWWMDITLNVENVLEFLSPALACSCPPSSLTLSISCLLIFRPSCLPLSVFLTNNCLSVNPFLLALLLRLAW